MNIIASFDHNVYVELALTSLEEVGITNENMLAIPLDKRTEERNLFDTIHRSDGVSLFDLAAALAVVGTVFASSYGFVAKWGPIIWGLIGAAAGALLGFMINWVYFKTKNKRDIKKGRSTELFVVIKCDDDQSDTVKKILWDHFALGVAKVDDVDE